MVMLHDAVKTVQNGVFPFFVKKERNLVSLKKKQKKRYFLNPALLRYVEKYALAFSHCVNRVATALFKIVLTCALISFVTVITLLRMVDVELKLTFLFRNINLNKHKNYTLKS